MRSIVRIIAIAVAASMAVPGALAWYSYGSNEPDNHWDRDPTYMFQDGPGSNTNRIYFNAFSGVCITGCGVSPNSATLGGRFTVGAGIQTIVGSPVNNGADVDTDGFEAFFGVWRDCNHDGYIGLADGALREYRIETATALGQKIDTTLCPSVPDDAAHAGTGIFNSNGWITEMNPLAVSDQTHGNTYSTDHRTIYDRYAMVWGDNGDPSTHDVPLGAIGCPGVLGGQQDITHTGGLLGHADCVDGHRPDSTRNQVVAAVPQLSVVPAPSSLWATGGPADKPVPSQVSGSDDSSNSFVSGEQDCSKDPMSVGPVSLDTTSTTGSHHPGDGKSGIRPVGQPKVNTNGNIRGTFNETHEESVVDDCNTKNDPGRDFDSAFNQVNLVAKDSGTDTTNIYKSTVDYLFSYRPWNNRQGTAKGGCGSGATGTLCGMPQDTGAPEQYTYQNSGDNMWARTGGPGSGMGGANVDTKGTLNPDLYPAEWYTFYAATSLTGYSTPPGVGTYGSQECGSIGTNAPPQHGWNCDPNQWWLIDGTTQHNLNYQDTDPNAPAGAHFWGTVGDSYEFRDVDCYDGTVVAASASPTHQDVGTHALPLVTKSTETCA